jgi:hypothetical protein
MEIQPQHLNIIKTDFIPQVLKTCGYARAAKHWHIQAIKVKKSCMLGLYDYFTHYFMPSHIIYNLWCVECKF